MQSGSSAGVKRREEEEKPPGDDLCTLKQTRTTPKKLGCSLSLPLPPPSFLLINAAVTFLLSRFSSSLCYTRPFHVSFFFLALLIASPGYLYGEKFSNFLTLCEPLPPLFKVSSDGISSRRPRVFCFVSASVLLFNHRKEVFKR